MTAERDRLATVLHDILCDPRLTFDCEVPHDLLADRLIAAGVRCPDPTQVVHVRITDGALVIAEGDGILDPDEEARR